MPSSICIGLFPFAFFTSWPSTLSLHIPPLETGYLTSASRQPPPPLPRPCGRQSSIHIKQPRRWRVGDKRPWQMQHAPGCGINTPKRCLRECLRGESDISGGLCLLTDHVKGHQWKGGSESFRKPRPSGVRCSCGLCRGSHALCSWLCEIARTILCTTPS